MYRSFLFGLAILTLSGCTSPNGTWLFTIEEPTAESVPSNLIHNFTGAVPKSEAADSTSGVTSDYAYTQSDGAQFGTILDLGGDSADKVLVLGDSVYPGTQADDGTWTFSWTSTADTDWTQANTNVGYQSTFIKHSTQTTVLVLDLQGDSGAGTLVTTIAIDSSWEESDTWSGENASYYGEIPSSSYLEDASGEDIDNVGDGTECDAALCTLSVTDGYTLTSEVQILRTSGEEVIGSAGQDFGLPSAD